MSQVHCRGEYVVSYLEGAQHFGPLREQWANLWRSCPEATEAQTWDWQSLYWKHVVPSRPPLFVTARDQSGNLAGVATFFIRRDRATLLKHLEFLGERDADYHVMLHRPDCPASVGRCMIETLTERAAGRAAVLEFRNTLADSWTATAVRDWLRVAKRGSASVECSLSDTYQIRLPGTMEAYWEMLSKGARKRFQYELRRLRRDFQVRLRQPESEQEVAVALDDIAAVRRRRWGRSGAEASSAEDAFLRQMIQALCRAGVCRLFLLDLDGCCAAYNVGMVLGRRVCFPYLAYDPTVAGKYSVGLMNNLLVIENCIESGLETFDLTRGSESYKSLLGATAVVSASVTVFQARTLRWVAVLNTRLTAPLLRRDWLKRMFRRLRVVRDEDLAGMAPAPQTASDD